MLKFNKTKKAIALSLGAFCMSPLLVDCPTAMAEYRSTSDTGTDIFDYIENRRRLRREYALTDEQIQFIEDAENFKSTLPQPIIEGETLPAAFEGDDLTYNTATGEFLAVGNVDVIQLDGYRFQTDEADGNINTKDIHIENKAHMLQFKDDAPRVSLDGYNAIYNYGTKTGTMDNVKGSAGGYYISGKRFEFYPDHIVAYDATQTRCNAKKPDYHLSAERMEIWPEQIIRMYDVKFWIGNTVVGTKEYEERKFESSAETYFPSFGYDSDYGFFVEDTFEVPILLPHWRGIINAHVETKNGVRSGAALRYNNRELESTLLYGYYNDSNGKWLKKTPSLETTFLKHFDHLPMSYYFKNVIGRWYQEGNASLHQEYEAGLNHDPIFFHKNWLLLLGTSYKITYERVRHTRGNYNNSTIKGFNYSATLGKEFDERFAAYIGYQYSKNNSQNSLFDFDMDSYSSKFLTGASYQLTDKDRFVVGLKFNAANGTLEDADYFWYRDLHCSTAIVRWRQKRHKWTVHWQFNPW